jgi:hypothetical protein
MAATIALALLIERAGGLGLLATLGRYSLQIYVAHTIASAGVRIVLAKVFRIGDPSIHLILGTIAGLLVPLALALLSERWHFEFLFHLKRPRAPRAGVALDDGTMKFELPRK